MQAFFTRAREDPSKFQLNVPRENIIEASMDLIVKTNAKDFGGHDPLKKPISIQFQGEPAIDEGGVRKEYFQSVI